MEAMIDNYRLLLERAGRLYAEHDAGRPEPFNVFSVLDIERDEVNCHSRFLKALLDYEKPGDEAKENLVDFLQGVVGVDNVDSFRQGVRVEREIDRIDIRVTTNDKQHAVVIENKIGAGDQWRQLCRYYRTMQEQSYGNIRLLYLTLDGSGPSDISFCSPDCEARSRCKTISYRNTLSWLERCQQRAYDEPELRESVAQYRRLVQKLTGTDFKGAYMNELTALCLEGEGNNLVLVHDLNEAMFQAKVHLLQQLWDEIDHALRRLPDTMIQDLPPFAETHPEHASEEKIKDFFTHGKSSYHGLFYPLGGGAFFGVQAGNPVGVIFGVRCSKGDHQDRYNELSKVLENGNHSCQWPWYQVAGGNLRLENPPPDRDDLRHLSNPANRNAHAQGIAQGLRPIWEIIQANRLLQNE